jgi:organic hydroperoxide reductase OsmC/OhrA
LGPGTTSYERCGREFSVGIERRPEPLGSAAAVFRGNATRHDPEDWLLAALAGGHMPSYLALCARRGVIVVAYEDDASGTLMLDGRGGGRCMSAVPRPTVTIADPSQRRKVGCRLVCGRSTLTSVGGESVDAALRQLDG